ncbi:MAG TPA: sigma-70 family RNA polymerase sigma factor [Longimicrobiales bacterium]
MSADWNRLYRSIFPDLVRFLHRKVWDRERAQDLAQEAFVRALRVEPDQPRAFLFAVAANLARDEARTVLRRKRHLTLLKSEVDGRAFRLDPARELDERERWERVREALEALTERDRDVLLLWDSGLDYEEIAHEAGLAVGAVGTTLARARKRLVAAFEAVEAGHEAHS